MDRNNLVYDPAAQMYRQNPLDPAGAALGQMDGVSGAATDQPAAAGPQQNYPEWLTNLSARGLASDWLPAAFVPTPADELHPRDIPPDAPVAAQTAPLSAGTNAALMALGNGQEGGSSSGPGSDTGSAPAGGGGDVGAADAGNDASSADAGASSASGDSGSAGGSGNGGSDAGGADSGSDGGFSRGGIVSPNKLIGPNPPGPDTGYAALKPGEGVLTDKAMKFYGKGIVAKLNKLAIPKEMFR